MHPRTRLVLTASATFAAGLLTGAAVFSSDIPDAPPPSDPPPAAQPPMPAEPMPVIASVTAVEEPPAAEPVPAAAAEAPSAAESEATTKALAARIAELTDGWGRMQADLAELRQRVVTMEQRAPESDAESAAAERRRPATPAQQRDALLRAGVTAEVADDLIWRRSQQSLAQLELRDEAAREGWLGSARYREERRRIAEQQVSFADEIGLDAYDRYLYATGQPNRVAVDSVLPGSAGEESGIQAGDVIERYGDQPVLDFNDLREATSAGERDELVPVTVVRGGERVELWLPRGPIGVGLDATRLEPNG